MPKEIFNWIVTPFGTKKANPHITYEDSQNPETRNILSPGGNWSGVKMAKIGNEIALYGNTYPVKEQIKKLGGRFSKGIQIGEYFEKGWVLPISAKSKIKNLINE